jgi:hypothetical protein
MGASHVSQFTGWLVTVGSVRRRRIKPRASVPIGDPAGDCRVAFARVCTREGGQVPARIAFDSRGRRPWRPDQNGVEYARLRGSWDAGAGTHFGTLPSVARVSSGA